jgi:hypothetical protein
MNDSIFPSIRPSGPPPHPGVYADLAESVRMKFRTRGFSFLPLQPVHSILAGPTPPDAGRLVMAEGELQLEVCTSDRGLRDRYQTEFSQRLGRIQELSHQREIPVLRLSTAEPVEGQIRRLLGNRPGGGAGRGK